MQILERTGEKSARMYLYGDIGEYFGGPTAEIVEKTLSEASDVEEISLRIHSQGGEALEGLAMHDSLRRHPAKVHVKVDGLAGSIASVIAMAGDTIEIAENGWMMIHEAYGGSFGTAAVMREDADMLDKITDRAAKAYARQSNFSESEARQMMADNNGEGHWFNAEEVMSHGLAQKIMQPVEAVAMAVDRTRFPNAPKVFQHTDAKGKAAEDLRRWKAQQKAREIAIRLRMLDIEADAA
ncbi:MAG: head maturation protease, ClpP-related [Planctomycetota bacterium]